MINETLNEADRRWTRPSRSTREDFAAIRTGRAQPVDVQQAHRRLLRHADAAAAARVVHRPRGAGHPHQPYDMSAMAAIEKAIRDSDLGVNPTDDGKTIRVRAARSSPRSAARSTSRWPRPRPRTAGSRSATSAATPSRRLEKLEKDGEVGKDDVTGAEKRLDGITKKHTDEIDEMLKHKEAELLEV